MNTQKLIAIVIAIAINCIALAWFHAWSANAIAHAARRAPGATARPIVTLPTISVHPTRAQLERLHHAPQVSASGLKVPVGGAGVQALAVPYDSFADASAAGHAG